MCVSVDVTMSLLSVITLWLNNRYVTTQTSWNCKNAVYMQYLLYSSLIDYSQHDDHNISIAMIS